MVADVPMHRLHQRRKKDFLHLHVIQIFMIVCGRQSVHQSQVIIPLISKKQSVVYYLVVQEESYLME